MRSSAPGASLGLVYISRITTAWLKLLADVNSRPWDMWLLLIRAEFKRYLLPEPPPPLDPPPLWELHGVDLETYEHMQANKQHNIQAGPEALELI